eukprot:366372-Chlamydomonas_euryale.AAC.12
MSLRCSAQKWRSWVSRGRSIGRRRAYPGVVWRGALRIPHVEVVPWPSAARHIGGRCSSPCSLLRHSSPRPRSPAPCSDAANAASGPRSPIPCNHAANASFPDAT